VVLLNYADAPAARRALASVEENLPQVPIELVVVENGSVEPVSYESRRGTPIRVLEFARNQGVAPGRNAGIAAATGEYVLILDDDAFVTTDLRPMLAFMDERKDVGVSGPLITDSFGGLMFTARRFPTALDKISRRLPSRWGAELLERSEFRDWDHDYAAYVDYVIGACQLLRSAAVAEVGPYDATTFYGPEDVDLCLRMWAAGWRVAYLPEVKVVHDERRITTRFTVLAVRHVTALLRYFLRHRYLLGRKRVYRRLGLTSLVGNPVPVDPG
jgi:GT2 family glycosyltransferase